MPTDEAWARSAWDGIQKNRRDRLMAKEMTSGPARRFVVAVNRKEAEDLASRIGWDTNAEAQKHLKQVKAPPTDPYYARQYKVFEVLCRCALDGESCPIHDPAGARD